MFLFAKFNLIRENDAQQKSYNYKNTNGINKRIRHYITIILFSNKKELSNDKLT